MLNHIELMGRLVRDPELRYTKTSVAVTTFSIACERDIKSKGERETDFLDCVAWRSTAEFVSKHFAKGDMICLQGKIQTRQWEDKDGNKRKSVEVIVDSVYFCGNKSTTYSEGLKTENAFEEISDENGELPF